jgi:catechol 2,3-dioxygenase-like lactoylglutathione lyase family enzyme
MDHVSVVVDDIDATVAGLRAQGAELVGEVAQYEDSYRLCYVRGPEGIIVAPAEELG